MNACKFSRRVLAALLACTIAWPSEGADDSKARAVIDKAIDAAGGKDKLKKAQATTWTEKGTYYGMGDGLPYTGKFAVQWPHQFRMEIEGAFVIVVTKDKGWVKNAEGVQEMDAEQFARQKENNHAGWVASLLPLSEKQFKLALSGDEKVDGRECSVVRVSSDGHRDVLLFFDKQSHLLSKVKSRVNSAEQGGKEVTQETTVTDYREVDGIRSPMKVALKHDGKHFVESEIQELKYVGKLSDDVFAKP